MSERLSKERSWHMFIAGVTRKYALSQSQVDMLRKAHDAGWEWARSGAKTANCVQCGRPMDFESRLMDTCSECEQAMNLDDHFRGYQ